MQLALRVAVLALFIWFQAGAQEPGPGRAPSSTTCSIAAWDSLTGDLGIAVESNLLAAGSIVPYASAGNGAVGTQAAANTGFGPQALEMLGRGMDARQVVEQLLQGDTDATSRQVGIVDSRGNSYSYTGSACPFFSGQVMGPGFCVLGCGLESEAVLNAVARTFQIAAGDLSDRMLAALEAGDRVSAGRTARRSAALLVVRDRGGFGGSGDRFVDIRVDDDSLPLTSLRRIYRDWQDTYLTAARMRSIEQFNRNRNYRAADGEMKRIVEGFNAELRSRPDDPEVLNRVARALAVNDIDRERALELAKRAVLLAPGRNDLMDTMAECHYRLGHYDEAIAIESDLVSKEPSNDVFWRQLQKFKEAKQKSGK